MTAKSRQRKRAKHPVEETKKYRFTTPTRSEEIISATSLQQAKHKFQEKFGYWPEKEYNDGEHNSSSDSRTSEESSGGAA